MDATKVLASFLRLFLRERLEVMDLFMEFVIRLSDLEARIVECVEPLLAHEGYELVRLKAGTDNGHSVMALFMDRASRDRAITMDDLQFLNGLLSDALDVADTEKPFFKDAYSLEVSSPGIERPLSKRRHFEAAIGKIIRVKTDALDALPRTVNGKLKDVSEEGIHIDSSRKDETIFVPFVRMKDAHEVFDFSTITPQKPKGKEKKIRPSSHGEK
jgi:ribosome maturation factor RimP